MVRVELKGIHRVRKKLKSGRVVEYHYAWRGGPKIWDSASTFPVGSVEYVNTYHNAGKPVIHNSVGTFRDVILAYQKHEAFTGKAEKTKYDYRQWLNRIDERFGDAPLSAFDDPRIRITAMEWRSQWSGRMAQYGWTVLKILVNFAYENQQLKFHHLREGNIEHKKLRAEIIWREADIVAFRQVAPKHVLDALTAAIETGLRPGDLVQLSRRHIEATPYGRRILKRTNKRKKLASVPVTPAMAEIIDAVPNGQLLILTNSRGEPWTTGGLSKAVKKYARIAGLDEALRFYDARGTAATRLLMAKVPLSEIAVMMGWSVKTAAQMIETYAVLDPSITDSVLVRLAEVKS